MGHMHSPCENCLGVGCESCPKYIQAKQLAEFEAKQCEDQLKWEQAQDVLVDPIQRSDSPKGWKQYTERLRHQ